MAILKTPKAKTAVFEIAGGARIVAPDSLDQITPYVLREQLDWFEDELPFLRKAILPGQQIVDVGANYGVYALSLAQVVGPHGAVWAFEPASSTAAILAEGIAVNQFEHIVLENCALSNKPGLAKLSLQSNSELNSLAHGDDDSGSSNEEVRVDTFDGCMQRLGWTEIDFVKIDAEGEESNIIKGGKRFLTEQTPLVLYEVKIDVSVHYELEAQFGSIGYASYRLVPGLNLLVPFERGINTDGFLLNLFCCKPDRAARLARRGLLLDPSALAVDEHVRLDKLLRISGSEHNWRRALTKLPYGALIEDRWTNAARLPDSQRLEDALSCYEISRDVRIVPLDRFIALRRSFQLLRDLCEENPINLRLASLARVARAYGSRSVAVESLAKLSNRIASENNVFVHEPFLAPNERFDNVPPGVNFGAWVLGGVLEELERLAEYSSFFASNDPRPRLEAIKSFGFASPEILRRLDLVNERVANR